MKKIFLILFPLFAAIAVMAEDPVLRVSGVLTDSVTGNPLPGYPIHIDIDTATGGFVYHREVHTMPDGVYMDSILFNPANIPSGVMRVTVLDCMLHPHFADFHFGPGALHFVENFTVCTGPPPPCQADFFAEFLPQPKTIHFVNTSDGPDGPWQWKFGDGINSELRDPIHTYQVPGVYHVILEMGDSTNGGCYDSKMHEIHVGDSTAGGCHAVFTWHADSNQQSKTVHFTDLSTGNGLSWQWSFGDNTFSTEQNPVHTYTDNGEYHVCLTITSANPACQDIECKVIHIGELLECESWFTHMANWLDVNFEGHIQMNHPATFSWDFGDGATGSGKNSQHHYMTPGVYPVTLTTVLNDSSHCTWKSTQSIMVGDSTNIHQLYGQVYAGPVPMLHGMVMISGMNPVQGNPPYMAISPINPGGIYTFPYIPHGDFVIWAIPFDSLGGYLPTFYGDVTHWEQAVIVHLGQPQNPYNIHLVHATLMPAGNAGIDGQVNTSGVKSASVDQIIMFLLNEQGEEIGFRRVEASGAFEFGNMAYGTYFLKPELPNTTSDLVKVVLDATTPVADVTMTYDGSKILGVAEVRFVKSFRLYPNPVQEILTFDISLLESANCTINIRNISGQVISEKTVLLSGGSDQVRMDVSSLRQGFYILTITSQDGTLIVQKFVK